MTFEIFLRDFEIFLRLAIFLRLFERVGDFFDRFAPLWKEEIDEFANIILEKLPVKTGNIYDAFMVMSMVEKIYSADKKGI